MAISRIDKLICENAGFKSLEESANRRCLDLDIYLGSDLTGKVAQMSLVVTALALRCFSGAIRFHFSPNGVASLPWSTAQLEYLLQNEAVQFGCKERLSFSGDKHGEIRLAIATDIENAVKIDVNGWSVGVNKTLPANCLPQSPASVFAACCGIAKIFGAYVLGDKKFITESWSRSLATFEDDRHVGQPCSSDNLNLGSIGLLGAGAIGTGFMYSLWLSTCHASVEIIDRDDYGEPNEETSLFVGSQEARRNRKKAIALCDLAAREGLTLVPAPVEVVKNHPILNRERSSFVVAVDNAETRRLFTETKPGLLVNGAVGGRIEDAGHVLWSRHSNENPSLASLYRRQSEESPKNETPKGFEDDCSRIAYSKASFAAPFLGTAAGALLLASCMLDAVGNWNNANYLKIDLLRLQSHWQIERLR